MTDNDIALRNKQLILDGLARFATGDIEVLRELLHPDFIEHSPGNPSGRDAFIDVIADAPVASARLDIKRVVADADHVVVHYHMVEADHPRGLAVTDIWRLVDGLITEHWDVVQAVPDAAEIPHGMF
ncbi:nuclear transport factor 2 family protein [Nocardia cyriacigeorgica]|uniref:nuclear transport factor 2 family protein n=1 Tax=Nocardia cyriacigeorgica TaxID=135487 RepID=UPI002453E80B|nr:nuclear transport factor 2 family protein [Nocardia cyriacigeorgica]